VAFTLWQLVGEQQGGDRLRLPGDRGAGYLAAIAPIQARLDQAASAGAPAPADAADAVAATQAAFGTTLDSATEAAAAATAIRAIRDVDTLGAARGKLRD